jgi:SAM-dependent methyltransferase
MGPMQSKGSIKSAIATNRLMWDDRVEAHWKSAMYTRDAEALRGGGHCLRGHILQTVGDVTDKSLIHLQCHMGMETLSWARLGADVVGLDFSQPAIDKAELLRDELGLKAEFHCQSLYDAPKVIDRRFDIVFQSIGCLCWLPDLKDWARVVASMLNDGGRYILNECHPFSDVLEQAPGSQDLMLVHSYLGDEAIEFNEGGTYADPDATFDHNRTIEHIYPLGDVVTSLIEAGLTIDRLNESPLCVFPRYAMMDYVSPDTWELPGAMRGKLPMSYTLVAHKR